MNISHMYRLPKVKLITGLSRSTIYRLVGEGKFPSPFKITNHASAWRATEIAEWVSSLQRKEPA